MQTGLWSWLKHNFATGDDKLASYSWCAPCLLCHMLDGVGN